MGGSRQEGVRISRTLRVFAILNPWRVSSPSRDWLAFTKKGS